MDFPSRIDKTLARLGPIDPASSVIEAQSEHGTLAHELCQWICSKEQYQSAINWSAKDIEESDSNEDTTDNITNHVLLISGGPDVDTTAVMGAIALQLSISELVRLAGLPSQIESLAIIDKFPFLKVQSGIVKLIGAEIWLESPGWQRLDDEDEMATVPVVQWYLANKALRFLSSYFEIATSYAPGLNLGPSESEEERTPGTYGTLHWIMHLINAEDIAEDAATADLVTSFVKNHFLLWLDVLAPEGLHADAAMSMKRLEGVLLEQEREKKSEPLEAQDFEQPRREALEQSGENEHIDIPSLVRDSIQLLRLHTSENSLSHKHPSSVIFYPEESALKQDWMAQNTTWLITPPRMTHSWNNIPLTLDTGTDSTHNIAFSPDGRFLASGSTPHGIRLWDAETGASQLTLQPLENGVRYVAFSPSGQLASVSESGILHLWDLDTGRSLKTLTVEGRAITAIRFSPNSKESEKLVLGTTKATYTEEVLEEEHHVCAVDFSQQETWIASGGARGSIKIWDAQHSNALQRTIQGHQGHVISVVFSRDEKRLASGSDDSTVRIWIVETGANLNSFDCRLPLRGLAFSPDDSFIAAGYGNRVKVWEIACSPQGRLASGSGDTTIQLWDFEGSVSKDANAQTSTSDENIYLWDGMTGLPMKSHTLSQHTVLSISFSPDGERLVSSSQDGIVRVWGVAKGSTSRTFKGHSDWCTFATFSPDGASIASASDDCTVRIWSCPPEAEGGDAIVLWGHNSSVTTVAFSPDGTSLVSGDKDSNMILWDRKSLRPKYTMTGQPGRIINAIFSRDSSRIVSRSDQSLAESTICVWDSITGAHIQGP
ncbi:WD40-repeat-containing domain protein [Trichoderma compactum]